MTVLQNGGSPALPPTPAPPPTAPIIHPLPGELGRTQKNIANLAHQSLHHHQAIGQSGPIVAIGQGPDGRIGVKFRDLATYIPLTHLGYNGLYGFFSHKLLPDVPSETAPATPCPHCRLGVLASYISGDCCLLCWHYATGRHPRCLTLATLPAGHLFAPEYAWPHMMPLFVRRKLNSVDKASRRIFCQHISLVADPEQGTVVKERTTTMLAAQCYVVPIELDDNGTERFYRLTAKDDQ